MNKLMKKVVVFMVAFSMLFTGLFAAGGTEVQAAANPAKVVMRSAKANYWRDEIAVSWKGVKKTTGYQVAFRKTNSSVYRKVAVRGKTSRTLRLDTYRTSYTIKVRAFRQVRVRGKVKTYYGKWSDTRTVKMKYTPPKTKPDSGSNGGGNSYSDNSGGGGNAQDSGDAGGGGDVWIPRTGKKYHSSSSCSGMKNPSLVSQSYAESMGYTPCKKCY